MTTNLGDQKFSNSKILKNNIKYKSGDRVKIFREGIDYF